MAKFKKRPVIPIYAIALVWVIFTLVHPLYRVSDYVTVILLSAVVFIVAKGIFPTISYEMPDPQPQAAALCFGRRNPQRRTPPRRPRKKPRPPRETPK